MNQTAREVGRVGQESVRKMLFPEAKETRPGGTGHKDEDIDKASAPHT